MLITYVNIAPGLTPVPYPNQAFINILNTNRQFTIVMYPRRRNQWLFYTGSFELLLLINDANGVGHIYMLL